VLENRVLRGIFRPARKNVTGCLKKLHNEEIQELYFTPHKINMIESRSCVGGLCSMHEREEKCIQNFCRKI
jgi:hypothetical protein